MKYITVSNRPNKISTVHDAACGTLRGGVNAPSDNAVRRDFDDGLMALEFAQAEYPQNFGFCKTCLKSVGQLIKSAR